MALLWAGLLGESLLLYVFVPTQTTTTLAPIRVSVSILALMADVGTQFSIVQIPSPLWALDDSLRCDE